MSTNQQEELKTFELLQEEYEKVRLILEEKPFGDHCTGFNEAAYHCNISCLGKGDLLMAQMIALKHGEIKFASIEQRDGKYYITYNPYASNLNNLEHMQYTIVPALPLRPKSIKIYQEACHQRIVWLVRMMDGPIERLFEFQLAKWMKDALWKSQKEAFAVDVADMMKSNPHTSCYKYINYVELFVQWLSKLESDNDVIIELVEHVMDQLKSLFCNADQIKYAKDGSIKARIGNSIAHLDWQRCSTDCNALFEKVDFSVDQKKLWLARMKQSFLLKKKEREMLQNEQSNRESTTACKRKAEEDFSQKNDNDNEKNGAKRARVERQSSCKRIIHLDAIFEELHNAAEEDEQLDLKPFRDFQKARMLQAAPAADSCI